MDHFIKLRSAEFRDIATIQGIIMDALREHDIPIPEDHSLADIEQIITGQQDGQVTVLMRNKTVVGMIVLRPIDRNCLELKRLYVSPAKRGKGLGKILLKHAIQAARAEAFRTIRLETTSTFKAAVNLYRKHGFVELPDVAKAPGHDLAFEKALE